jgi:ABC-type sugar transport system substrate-binding protein
MRAATVLVVVAIAAAGVSMTVAGSSSAAPSAMPEIVWLAQGAGNPYWDAQRRAAEEAGRRLGFRLRWLSGNLNPSDQAAIFRQLVDERVDLVMVDAIDPRILGPSLSYAKARKVQTVFLNGVDSRAMASIRFDEIRSGQVAAAQALKQLERYHVSGKIAVLAGIRGQPASDERARAFIARMKANGRAVVAVEQTNWQADRAASAMRGWLMKYRDLSMVFSVSDILAVTAINEAERNGRLCTQEKSWDRIPSCVALVSIDGFSIEQVIQGRLLFTELYSPYWTGYTYAKLAFEILKHKYVKSRTSFNSILVTQDNARCLNRMATDMKVNLGTFQFEGTLQDIARRYRCSVVDANP